MAAIDSSCESYRVAFEIGGAPSSRRSAVRNRIELEPGKVERGLLQLVLSLVELIRQLLEKQAMRRIEAGGLTPQETDRLGCTLMELEAKIKDLQQQFEIEDLNINLGPLGNLLEE